MLSRFAPSAAARVYSLDPAPVIFNVGLPDRIMIISNLKKIIIYTLVGSFILIELYYSSVIGKNLTGECISEVGIFILFIPGMILLPLGFLIQEARLEHPRIVYIIMGSLATAIPITLVAVILGVFIK